MPDIDGNSSFEILAGSDASRVVLLSGGLQAGPVSVEEREALPQEFALHQNYPNPFNPSTKIGFKVQGSGFVSLKVYDVLGREVRTLVSEELKPGSYEVPFDAAGLASGVYFYRLRAGGFTQTRTMVVLR
jgi:hypothetical protein